MQNHPIHPPPEVARLTRPASPVGPASVMALPTKTQGRNKLWDRLCAVAVIAVILATSMMVCAYAAREVGLYREAGSTTAVTAPAAAPVGTLRDAAGASSSAAGMDRTSLMAFSMGIDLLIFIGLGLYLRWDAEREQKK